MGNEEWTGKEEVSGKQETVHHERIALIYVIEICLNGPMLIPSVLWIRDKST